MKVLVAIIIFLVPLISTAQETTTETSRFSVGVNFSPNYSYRTLSYPEEMESSVEAREKTEHPSFGFNTGIAMRYLVFQKLEIELGVQFSRQAIVFKSVPFVDATGSIDGEAKNQQRFHYLEIPLRLNYRVIDKQIFAYVTAGASLNQFLNDNSKTWITHSNGDKQVVNSGTTIDDFNKKSVSLIAGIGIGYHIDTRFDVRAEPLFRYSHTALADTPIKQYNYSIGCQLGLNWKF